MAKRGRSSKGGLFQAVSEDAPTQEIDLSKVKPEDLQPVNAPIFAASMVHVQGTPNEMLITFGRLRPAGLKSGGQPLAVSEPVAIVSLSPQSIKDLFLVMGDVIGKYEIDHGEIVTAFSKQRVAQKTRAKRVH